VEEWSPCNEAAASHARGDDPKHLVEVDLPGGGVAAGGERHLARRGERARGIKHQRRAVTRGVAAQVEIESKV